MAVVELSIRLQWYQICISSTWASPNQNSENGSVVAQVLQARVVLGIFVEKDSCALGWGSWGLPKGGDGSVGMDLYPPWAPGCQLKLAAADGVTS